MGRPAHLRPVCHLEHVSTRGVVMNLCRVVAGAVCIVLCACAEDPPPQASTETAEPTVNILRDAYGTPHVFAEDNYGVYFGYGYAVAEDRLFQMEMLRRTTQGRVAEVLGSEYLALDTHIRTGYDHPSVRRQVAALGEADRELLQAYADGFSQRIAEVLADRALMLPAEFSHFGFDPQPWTALDVAMLFVGAIAHRYSDFNSELDNQQLLSHLEQAHGKDTAWRIFNASKWLLDVDSPTTVPRGDKALPIAAPERPGYLPPGDTPPTTRRVAIDERGAFTGTTDDPGVAAAFLQRLRREGFSFSPEFSPASNFWAANNTRDAKAALVNGPQFGFSVPSYVYGIGLHGGDFQVVGNTLLGLPALLFAHNNALAWGSTAGASDQVDVYVETLHPENPEQYLHNGRYHDFESWLETIAVRDAEAVTLTARRSVHGMVQQLDVGGKRAFVRARAWEGSELASLMAWINLARDHTLDEAQRRIGSVATNINFYYMDLQGNLAYTHGGRYPVRRPGQDSRLPTPGTGEWDWQGYSPYADNPTVRNPTQKFIANWNNRPAAHWISSDVWTSTWARADRNQLIVDALQSLGSPSVEDLWQVNRQLSFADVSAPFLLPALRQAWDEVETPENVQRALDLLQDWDRRWVPDEQGYYGAAPTLMESWLVKLLERVFLDEVGEPFFHLFGSTNNPSRPLGASMKTAPGTKALVRNLDQLERGLRRTDYDFFNGADHRQVLRETFEHSLQGLVEQLGPDDSQWSLAAQPMQWKPFNFRGVPQALPDATLELPGYMNRGSENNLFVATGTGIEGFDVIPGGQSGFVHPDGVPDPHVSDQLELFARFGYKAIPFTLEAVETNTVSSRTLTYPKR